MAVAGPIRPGNTARVNQRAWAVLITAFLVFCAICVVTGYGINYFLFVSTVPMQATLEVGWGTVAYQQRSDLDENVAPRSGHLIANNERITLNPESQATLLFRDPYQNNRLIASVTMKGGASLSMTAAARPRFEFSNGRYRINLGRVNGEIDVYVPEGLQREFWLSAENGSNAFAVVAAGGLYTISSTDEQLSLLNRRGQAVLVANDDAQTSRLVAPGERGTMRMDSPAHETAIVQGPLNLLQPGQLQQQPVQELANSSTLLPDLVWPWQCGDIQNPPPGRYEIGMPQGRPAIRLVRADNAQSHGETACSQAPGPGQTGRDMTPFSSLVLKTTFYIESHSIARCGFDGSECPLIMQIDYLYRDELGEEQPNQWFHGFYVNPDPSGTFRSLCLSCLLDHDQVYPGSWYTYESPNLFNLIPQENRPISLLRVRFYASGHQYDVYVSDVALFAS